MPFRRRKQEPQLDREADKTVSHEVKYPQPRILLIDLSSDAEATLRAEGYNVTTGSLGVPYRVQKGDGFFPVIANGRLPFSVTEQEIVVLDLQLPQPLEEPAGEKHISKGELDWWAKCSQGIIDPRPRVAVRYREAFDRILSHGGVFVIFAAQRLQQHLVLARAVPRGYSEELLERESISADSWSFLSALNNLGVVQDQGVQMLVASEVAEAPVGRCLSDHANGSYFCTIHPGRASEERWLSLATSRYGEPIAGVLATEKDETSRRARGLIFILPQLRDKPGFLSTFLKEVLPEFSPHLFPHVEGARWVQRPDYELPEVVCLKEQIRLVRQNAGQQIASLEEAMEEQRRKDGYLHDLLRETGRPLVVAVQRALRTLGFQQVVDVDAELERTGDAGPKREDLQIRDTSPTVLVEVKGISGLPRDADALQVWKYVAPRMKEWNRTDIRGLSIVNHQRHLPALERENAVPFREDIITNAEQQEFGLMTTWDLFRLLRGHLKNNWGPAHIKPLFYRSGRIEPIPIHYEYLGVVERFWGKVGAVGVRIKAAELKRGDRIAFELPVEFEEQDAASVEVDRKPIQCVAAGELAGIATHLTKEQAKKGTRVYRVRASITTQPSEQGTEATDS